MGIKAIIDNCRNLNKKGRKGDQPAAPAGIATITGISAAGAVDDTSFVGSAMQLMLPRIKVYYKHLYEADCLFFKFLVDTSRCCYIFCICDISTILA